MSVKARSSGSMATLRFLPRVVSELFTSAAATSLAESRSIRRMLTNAPKLAPKAKLATVVTVVVTLDIKPNA